MSHLRRVVALTTLALFGWLAAYGAVGAVSASASVTSAQTGGGGDSYCC